jgi:hypothetical protein
MLAGPRGFSEEQASRRKSATAKDPASILVNAMPLV